MLRVFHDRKYRLSPERVLGFLHERTDWDLEVVEQTGQFGPFASIHERGFAESSAMEWWTVYVMSRKYQRNVPPGVDRLSERDERGIAWSITEPGETDPEHSGRRSVVAQKQYGNLRLYFQLDSRRSHPPLDYLDALLTELTVDIANPS